MSKNKPCPAIQNYDVDYHLSGDAYSYCTCALTNKHCLGFEVLDPDDQSSQFFSRGKNVFNERKAQNCPVYGASVETIAQLIKERSEKETQNKLDLLK
jgi:hypothetical protein